MNGQGVKCFGYLDGARMEWSITGPEALLLVLFWCGKGWPIELWWSPCMSLWNWRFWCKKSHTGPFLQNPLFFRNGQGVKCFEYLDGARLEWSVTDPGALLLVSSIVGLVLLVLSSLLASTDLRLSTTSMSETLDWSLTETLGWSFIIVTDSSSVLNSFSRDGPLV